MGDGTDLTVRQCLTLQSCAIEVETVVLAIKHVCLLYQALFKCGASRVLVAGQTSSLCEQLGAVKTESGVLKAKIPALNRQIRLDGTIWLFSEEDWYHRKIT